MTFRSLLLRSVRKVVREAGLRGEPMVMRLELSSCNAADAEKIHTFTTPAELRALYRLACACPAASNVVEIGSYVGASTCYLAAGLARGGSRLICIDTWQNETMPGGIRDTLQEFERNTAAFRPIISMVRKRSDQLEGSDLPERIQLAFLDGDHSYQATSADFELIAPRITEEGIVAFHDSKYYEGVSQTIGDALRSGRWYVAGNVENLTWLSRSAWKPFMDASTAEDTAEDRKAGE